MKKELICLVMASALVGCGGGAPYVGLWQCATDPGRSLEVKQYEDYFIIIANDHGKQNRRDGRFDNEEFSVGANNVGHPMTFELNEGQLTCTYPPNFCHCNGVYDKVNSLSSTSKPDVPQEIKPEETNSLLAASTDAPRISPGIPSGTPGIAKQVVLDREPLTLMLVNGGAVQLFDDVNNEDNEKRMFDWGKLTYYYLPNLVFTKLPNGQLAEVRDIDNEVYIFLQLAVQKIDKFELMERIDELINTKIIPELVLPLIYEQMTVAIPGSTVSSVIVSGASIDAKTSVVDVSLRVQENAESGVSGRLKTGHEIVAAINDGSLLPSVTIEITQRVANEKNSQLQDQQVEKPWNIAN